VYDMSFVCTGSLLGASPLLASCCVGLGDL
jgi:hypothetical protein